MPAPLNQIQRSSECSDMFSGKSVLRLLILFLRYKNIFYGIRYAKRDFAHSKISFFALFVAENMVGQLDWKAAISSRTFTAPAADRTTRWSGSVFNQVVVMYSVRKTLFYALGNFLFPSCRKMLHATRLKNSHLNSSNPALWNNPLFNLVT